MRGDSNSEKSVEGVLEIPYKQGIQLL